MRFEAYDGSRAGSREATLTIRLVDPAAASYLVTAPGDARAGPRLHAG